MAYPNPNQPQQPVQPAPSAAGAFNQQRQRLQQRFTQQGQEQDDAIKRKMAQLGNLNSGAAMKIQQQGQDQLVQQREEAIGNLDSQQAQQQLQLDEAQRGRDFQRGMFDQTFGLQRDQFDVDRTMKLGQLGLAGREMDLKQLEQDWNILTSGREQGYGWELSQGLPEHLRQKLYSPEYQAVLARRAEEEKQKFLSGAYKQPFPSVR